MPPIHGSKARLLLSGFEITQNMREGSTPMSSDVSDSSTWGMTSKRYTPSDKVDGSFVGAGVWESAAAGLGSIDELLNTNLGGLHVATYLPGGDGFGNRAAIIGGSESNFEIDSPTDEIVGFSFELQAEKGFGRGRVLRPLAGSLAVSAGGNGTALDHGAVGVPTLRGASAALHVTDKGGGAGTLTVKVQHSPDNSVWTDLITFTGRTAADLAEYIEVTGSIQRYLRALWTVTGGTWDFHVAAARK